MQRTRDQLRYEVKAYVLDTPAELLKNRIRRRAELMLNAGWIAEAQRALAAGLLTTPTAHQALGYRLIAEYLSGKFDRAALLEKIATATWQLARRQRTWFSHQHPEARMLAMPTEAEKLLAELVHFYRS